MQPPFTHLSYFRLTSRWQADIGLGRKCEPDSRKHEDVFDSSYEVSKAKRTLL